MKRERMTFALCSSAILMGSVVSFACVMCLAEAFQLQCDPKTLILLCCAVCGVAAAVMSLKHSTVFSLCVFVVYFAVLIWKGSAVLGGLQTLIYHVTEAYAQCFENVAVLGSPEGDPQWFLGALSVPLAWLCVWTVCREGYTFFVALACAPVLILCLMVVDLAPVLWLVLLTAALMLLLLSGSVRLHSACAGGRLIWWLAPPVAILVFALMILSPVENYVRSDWSSNLQRVAEGNFDFELWRNKMTTAIGAQWSGDLKSVDLSKVGPKSKTGVHALQYQSSVPIRFLRGSSLERYEDNAWGKAEFSLSPTVEDTQLVRPASTYETVLIETNVGEALFYTAYYPTMAPENASMMSDAYFENPDKVRGYAVRFNAQSPAQISPEYEAFVTETYLQLPDTLQTPLKQYLQDSGLSGASAEAIADAVRSSGVYDLNTPAVPDGEDFVLYFLTQSHQGYCIHFATSTVLLLRAAGIPARYVTGYAVDGAPEQWNAVTEDDAHAWVEYYLAGAGWQPLDPTPAAYREEDPDPVSPPGEEIPPAEQPPATQEPEATAPPAVKPSGETAQSSLAWWWLIVPAALLVLILRRFAVLYCRRVQADRGEPNRRALNAFQRLVRLYRAQHEAVPECWICLAEKAKFSQHEISVEELEHLSDEIHTQIERLKQSPPLHKLWHRFGPVLY